MRATRTPGTLAGLAIASAVMSSCFIITEQDIRQHDSRLGPKDEADADTDSDSDSDADTDTDTDTDTGPVPTGPEVDELRGKIEVDLIRLAFRLSDPDGDLAEGSVQLLVNGVEYETFLLSGLSFDGERYLLDLAEQLPCEGFDRTYTIIATDAAGNVSLPADLQLTLRGARLYEGIAEPTGLGTVPFPALLCGQHDYTGDYDTVSFDTPSAGIWRITLMHGGETDRDLYLYDQYYTVVDQTEDSSYPEFLTYLFFPGTYLIHIGQFPDFPGEYRAYVTDEDPL